MKLRLLEWGDTVAHRLFDGYINHTFANGRHLPGWGWLQYAIYRGLCCPYEDEWDRRSLK